MDYFCNKIKGLRQPRPESPKYQRARIIQETCSPRLSTNSDASYYTASPHFIDRVILGRSIYIKRHDDEETNYSESEFVIDCLNWHNFFREKHDVQELKLNNQLCSMAQFWANHLAHTNTFSHRNIRDIGENLFCKWSYIPDLDITGQQVTKYWYEEIKMYNFFQEQNLLHVGAGHFTQMIWRSSTDFGVGKARSRCGKVLVVANYKPAGNVVGEFQENVFPPINDMDILNEIG